MERRVADRKGRRAKHAGKDNQRENRTQRAKKKAGGEDRKKRGYRLFSIRKV